MSLQRLASKGRHGDNTLLHIHPSELVGLAALTGKPITINPETGLPEMFSWKKLLLGAGLLAAPFTGGLSALGSLAPVIAPIMGGTALGSIIGAFTDKGKKKDPPVSEASKALDKRNDVLRQPQTFYAPMMVNSSARPNLLGIEEPSYVSPAGISALDMSPARYAKGGRTNCYAEGGQLEPEEQQAKDIVVQYLAALKGQHAQPDQAESQFIEHYGLQAAQDLRNGGLIHGPGGGMDDVIVGSIQGQKALFSDKEYAVPADAVSMLGDGSSDAGGRKLDAMVARIRKAKTGTTKQAPKISNKILPR